MALAEQMDVYISRAGLGRWTQLIIECQRLQILNSLGEHRTVLITVQQLRDELLASGIIRYQTGSGLLSTTLSNLVDSMLPSILPTFDAVADTVEQIEGVNFRELCARLSIRVPDGNTAITAIWALVQTERTKQAAESDAKPAKTLEQFEPLCSLSQRWQLAQWMR